MASKNSTRIASLLGTWTGQTHLKTGIGSYELEAYFVVHLMPDPMRGYSCSLKGCSEFEKLYERCAIVNLPEIGEITLLSLPDLVQSKKTQREKDWLMIRRLIEADILQFRNNPEKNKIKFWLKECRTPSQLVSLTSDYPDLYHAVIAIRPLLEYARKKDFNTLEEHLKIEECAEKEKDREYWLPLKKELEKWRMERHTKEG